MSTAFAPNASRPGRRRRGKTTLIVAGILVIVALVAAGAFAVRSGGRDVDPAQAGDLFQVSPNSFEIVITTNGELQPASQIELRNDTGRDGVITYIVPEGQTVEPGEVLVRFNPEQIDRELTTETQQLESARSDYVAASESLEIQKNENASALRKAELDLELAKLELQQWEEGDLVARRKELDLRIETTERDYDRLKRLFEQSEKLYGKDYISFDEFEQDRIRYLEAANAREIAKLNKQVYDAYEEPRMRKSMTSAVTEADAEIERVQRRNASELAQRQANLKNRKSQLLIREREVEKLEARREACEIIAPSGGLVVYSTSMDRGRRWGGDDGPWQVGSRVSPRESVIVLPDTSTMMADVKVHESLTSRIKTGQSASVYVDAVGGMTFPAVVESIGVLAEDGGWRDPNLREYTVRLKLEDGQGAGLKPSMRCEARILLDEVEDALSVPVQAVFNDAGKTYCYVAEDGFYVRRPVQVGRFSETWIEIVGGVDPGEVVLLRQPKPGEIKRVNGDAENGAAAEDGEADPGQGDGPPRGSQPQAAPTGGG
jgi:HlyD family secretion protein